jgi:tetratricopeptide (TPR) repeat protein
MLDLSTLHRYRNRYADAVACARQAVDLFDDDDRAGRATGILRHAELLPGVTADLAPALHLARDARRRYEELDDRLGVAHAMVVEGELRGIVGQLEEGIALCLEGRHRLGREADRFAAARVLRDVAIMRYRSGDRAGAVDAADTALREARELGDRFLEAQTLTSLGAFHLADPAGPGRPLLVESAELFDEMKDRYWQAASRSYLAEALLRDGDRDAAGAQARWALAVAREVGPRDRVGPLAEIVRAGGQAPPAGSAPLEPPPLPPRAPSPVRSGPAAAG